MMGIREETPKFSGKKGYWVKVMTIFAKDTA
ncbi:hypothetical protein QG37_07912 [Candidozyma auris]|uniref:Uncharacterized protein n=1 Tax=Candidozyma auris TaxID=498019 RepID=A0A0L0NQ58_CANAR|nr:hypothetical protein QG37_07912 [[Candida] auris]